MKFRRVFHVLPEDEPFSQIRGGAISRVVANLIKDDPSAAVLCSAADGSWNVPADQVRTSLLLRLYAVSRPLRLLLLRVKPALRILLGLVLRKVQKGDVVWIHSRVLHAVLLNRSATNRGFRIVLHMHNDTGWKPEMASLLKGVTIVFVSQALANEALVKCPGLESVGILHNGADPEVYHPGSRSMIHAMDRCITILFVGRLIPQKGVHILLEAMRILEQLAIPVRARIVGSAGFAVGGTSRYIGQLTSDSPSTVVFEDYKSGSAVAEFYREADIFCCPSIWNDPCPLVLFEALATGLPIVASRAGGIPEILAFGGGVLVPPEDAPVLADALASLATDRIRRIELGAEALRSFTDNFTWTAVRERYRMILEVL
jgi:spore coat protein SA